MKKQILSKIIGTFVLAFLFSTLQAQTVTLTFTGKDANNQYVQLNRVAITNLTKGWQETIYWPDTTLTMQNGTGIDESVANGGFALSQNNPNPFTVTTDVNLTVTDAGAVALEIVDGNGKIVETRHGTSLQPGTHQFRVSLSTAGAYVMTARQNGKTSSIKMVCNGGGNGNGIEYIGMVPTITYVLKSTTNNPFTFGDQMEYVGYATINGTEYESQHITQMQNASETITLHFTTTQGTLPIVFTEAVTNISSYNATCGGNVTSDGGTAVTARGVCWRTSQEPTVSGRHTTDGSGTGSFTSSLTGLTPNTTYYVRAYAINNVGTGYGEELVFTTSPRTPIITANTIITNITDSSAIGGGEVVSDGGAEVTERGVCWSTSPFPTIADSHTIDGSGTGSFISNLTELNRGTQYYVRAYATNSIGTSYTPYTGITFFTSNIYDGQPCFGADTLTDRDSNRYGTIQIGSQCWMSENLRTTVYADGTTIPRGYNVSDSVAYWYYPNCDPSNKPSYGLLYNWKAVMRNSPSSNSNPSGIQGICPTGWHVPSLDEWIQFADYVGSQGQYLCDSNSMYIAKALASTTGWSNNNSACNIGNEQSTNNATGFNAKPAGRGPGCGPYTDYTFFGSQAVFTCSTKFDNITYIASQSLYSNGNELCYPSAYGGTGLSAAGLGTAISVRCLKD